MKNKIIDCILFYDEIEMLNFRFHELDSQVDYFIIIESDKDLLGNPKPFHFEKNKDMFNSFNEKIINLVCEIPDNCFGENVINKCLDELCIKLRKLNLEFEDIIMYSHVDEIPDLSCLELIKESLLFSMVRLKQKEFVWNQEWFNHNSHYGTIIVDFTKLIHSKNNIFIGESSIMANSFFIDCGWHFSQFQDLEKIKNKLKLLSSINQTENYDLEFLRDNLLSIVNPKIQLKKSDAILPTNLKLLPFNEVGRKLPKNHIINLEDFKSKIFIPKTEYYKTELVKKYGFELVYFLNEIKKILIKFYPIDDDIFYFKDYNKEYKWSDIKNTFLADLLLN